MATPAAVYDARMSWSAKQYVAFEDERTRPVRDLLAAVPDGYGGRAIDLGCGPGNSTEVLSAKLPAARVSGLDSSPDMIGAARKRLPRLEFSVGDIAAWREPGPFDVILANAVLQWLPDHASLFPALLAKLELGGALAVQMPDNLSEPAHRLMRETAMDGPWAGKLGGAAETRTTLNDAAWYFDVLRPRAARVDIWRTTYHHQLAGGVGAVVEWFKGSGLRPFLDPLSATERSAFLERYTLGIAPFFRERADGSVLLPFPRLFLVAIC
jgi:trans-aconitate 2-methyltransferase